MGDLNNSLPSPPLFTGFNAQIEASDIIINASELNPDLLSFILILPTHVSAGWFVQSAKMLQQFLQIRISTSCSECCQVTAYRETPTIILNKTNGLQCYDNFVMFNASNNLPLQLKKNYELGLRIGHYATGSLTLSKYKGNRGNLVYH